MEIFIFKNDFLIIFIFQSYRGEFKRFARGVENQWKFCQAVHIKKGNNLNLKLFLRLPCIRQKNIPKRPIFIPESKTSKTK